MGKKELLKKSSRTALGNFPREDLVQANVNNDLVSKTFTNKKRHQHLMKAVKLVEDCLKDFDDGVTGEGECLKKLNEHNIFDIGAARAIVDQCKEINGIIGESGDIIDDPKFSADIAAMFEKKFGEKMGEKPWQLTDFEMDKGSGNWMSDKEDQVPSWVKSFEYQCFEHTREKGKDDMTMDEIRDSFNTSMRKALGDKEGFHFDKTVRSLIEQTEAATGRIGSPLNLMDFVEQWEDLLDMKLQRGLPGAMVDRKTAAVVSGTMYEHATKGQQTFVIGPNVYRMLKDTSLAGIRFEDIKLPFDCFYIQLPLGLHKLWGGKRTQWHNCTGVYVRKCMYFEKTHHGDHPENLMLLSVGAPNERSKLWGDDANSWGILSAPHCEKFKDIESYFIDREEDSKSSGFSNELEQGCSDPLLDELFKAEAERLRISGMESDESLEIAANEHNIREHFKIMRIAINAIMYINTKGMELDELSGPTPKQEIDRKALLAKKRKKERRLGKSHPTLKHKITKLMMPTVRQIGLSFERTSPTYTEFDIPVRGHYRRFKDGKITWIKPHIRRKSDKSSLKEIPRVFEIWDNKKEESNGRVKEA